VLARERNPAQLSRRPASGVALIQEKYPDHGGVEKGRKIRHTGSALSAPHTALWGSGPKDPGHTLACGQHLKLAIICILANGQLITALDYFVALVRCPRVEPSLPCV